MSDHVSEEDVYALVRAIMRELIRSGGTDPGVRLSALIMCLATNWAVCGYTPEQGEALLRVSTGKAKESAILRQLSAALGGRN